MGVWLALLVQGMCLCLARADLVVPASLLLEEESPGRFRMELRLPLVNGKVIKARPALPDACRLTPLGEPRSTGSAVVQSWEVVCDRDALIGAPLGVSGLLGTSQDVQLTLRFLDGREQVVILTPRRSWTVVPAPPGWGDLALQRGREGLRWFVGNRSLLVLGLLAAVAGWSRSTLIAGGLAYLVGLGAGMLLTGRMSGWVPEAATAGMLGWTAWRSLEPVGIRSRIPVPAAAALLLTGLLAGGGMEGGTTATLSLVQHRFGMAFFLAGVAVAGGMVVLAGLQLRAAGLVSGTGSIGGRTCRRWGAMIVASVAWGYALYQSLSWPLSQSLLPPVSPLSLVGLIALAWWLPAGRPTTRTIRGSAVWVAALFAFSAWVGFTTETRAPAEWNLGVLAVFGVLLVLGHGFTGMTVFGTAVVVAVLQGLLAAGVVAEAGTLGSSEMVFSLAVLLLVLLAGLGSATRTGPPWGCRIRRVVGVGTLIAAFGLQAVSTQQWLRESFAADALVGVFRVPVLSLLLLTTAVALWPRRRRFRNPVPGRRAAAVGCLVMSLCLLPVGGLRFPNPWYAPTAPTTAQAEQILSALLTETYLAFNADDEDDAYDRLSTTVTEDLVPGLYLDSRRRLFTGVLTGGSVTIRDVRVLEVGEGGSESNHEFLYPCRWAVIARVRHTKHVHDRKNAYRGSITLRIEDQHWKLAALVLESEDRVVLSWKNL